MKEFTFVTGNNDKAKYLAKLIGLPVNHQSVDVDEVQNTVLKDVVEHKAIKAYDAIGSPVLVEDTSLIFNALVSLPGTYIKFFVEESGLEACCTMLDGFKDRSATASSGFGYYDGKTFTYFEGRINGSISQKPDNGKTGFGWDRIFVPDGYDGKARSSHSEEIYEEVYLKIKPIDKLRKFLKNS